MMVHSWVRVDHHCGRGGKRSSTHPHSEDEKRLTKTSIYEHTDKNTDTNENEGEADAEEELVRDANPQLVSQRHVWNVLIFFICIHGTR